MKDVLACVAVLLAISSLAKADEPLVGKDNSPSTTGGRSTSVPELPGMDEKAKDERVNPPHPEKEASRELAPEAKKAEPAK